jgi:hypothetical protein
VVKVAAASIVRTEGEEAYATIFKNFMGLGASPVLKKTLRRYVRAVNGGRCERNFVNLSKNIRAIQRLWWRGSRNSCFG